MNFIKKHGVLIFVAGTVAIVLALAIAFSGGQREEPIVLKKHPVAGSHLDHTPFFPEKIENPKDVTRACLKCHREEATDFMKTSHWLWLGEETTIPGHAKPMRIGKKNLINNFCIAIAGNWNSCTKCHPGYGWSDDSFDFKNPENVDCLICHDRSDTYGKGAYGFPLPSVDLQKVAQKVGRPSRANCLTCHGYGGGGEGVKHGDMDASLDNPAGKEDVHMGKHNFLCTDCHVTKHHDIKGRAFSVSVEGKNVVGCTNCHVNVPHKNERINDHLDSVACQTCHIPSFARRRPTKTEWDWSKAGDGARPEDPHQYLKIKGEFVYDNNVVPDYRWFNNTMERYIMGDKLDPAKLTDINHPRGDINDPKAKIWPFKVHLTKQPYDAKNRWLLAPTTGGEGGFWHNFDWQKAFELGAEATNLPYSGEYGFADTRMFWPISHMVAPKEETLRCNDCHGVNGRMDWKSLGYYQDPIETGGRK